MKKATTKWKRWVLSFQLILFGFLAAAQTPISGTVTDNAGDPLPGVSVIIKGTDKGTVTDIDGKFSVNVEDGNNLLVFSFIGFIAQEVAIEGQTVFTITLEEDIQQLEEVVVIGYGTQKKKEVTGAVSSIKAEEMTRVVASDFTKSLQGQMAGVSVTESSGRPGDQANIQIRGLGSISGSSSPLYVVDGIPYQGNPNIASEDIATVDILKDGAAAAVYGTRASNGVILITTKRGEVGKTKVSFSSYYGIQNITSGTPLMNTEEHLYVDEMVNRAEGGNSSILFYNPDALDYNTDFVGSIVNDNAAIQSHNLTLSGGQDNLKFSVNTNYFNQDGILIQSGYERFSTRGNATFKKGKFEAFASVGIQATQKDQEPWGLYEFAIFQGPYRKPLGDLEQNGSEVIIPGNNPDHVGYFSQLLDQTDVRDENSYNIAGNLKYEIIDGLTYQVNFGLNKYNYQRNFWRPQYLVYAEDGTLNELGSRKDAILQEDFRYQTKRTLENVLRYEKKFGSHNVSLLAGYTYENTEFKEVTTEKRNFISNDVQVFNGGSELTRLNGYNTTNVLIGKLARVQYSFKDKYLFSASIRHDGSSKFGESNRYGTFPGVSVGWNISEEAFLQGVDAIESLKLRGSYAEVGNEGIPNYLYEGFIDANIDYVWGPEGSDELVSGAIQRGYANPLIGWESNISRNIGVDLSMFSGKLSFTADVYKNDKKDMLLDVLLPASTGTNVPNDWNSDYKSKVSNIGNMVNQGIELSANYRHTSSSGLNWNVTGVFTANQNEITDLAGLESIPLTDSKPGNWRANQQDITTYMRPGYEAGAFFLIPTDGIIKTEDELAAVKEYMPNARLGDLKYIDQLTVDTDGDGIPDATDGQINDEDRVYQGSGMPKFEAGLKLGADYKGFDFNVHFFYSHGNKVFNGSKLFAYSMKRHKDLYYMWTEANSDSDVMAARQNSEHDNFRSRSDFFLEEGSFLRVRTISLGYSFPKAMFNNKIDRLRVYANAQNLFTFTDYEGYDPEVGGNGVSTRGIDKGSYPVTRKIMMGIQVDF
ncbi:TonB-dependent receptor [Flammeovirgaceae bacterium SG7u.111]|nr:TonB-dependent receptor [Flammeovirgaceae bacterium SG7u.132]WPO33667.1 TonB-dependent receptor [Flammeovirgaceae bacterium SG7u.111]